MCPLASSDLYFFSQVLLFILKDVSTTQIEYSSPSNSTIFLLTGLHIYTGEYEAQGPT